MRGPSTIAPARPATPPIGVHDAGAGEVDVAEAEVACCCRAWPASRRPRSRRRTAGSRCAPQNRPQPTNAFHFHRSAIAPVGIVAVGVHERHHVEEERRDRRRCSATPPRSSAPKPPFQRNTQFAGADERVRRSALSKPKQPGVAVAAEHERRSRRGRRRRSRGRRWRSSCSTTCAACLARQKPVSTSAKPACMKITSTAPMTTHSRFELTRDVACAYQPGRCTPASGQSRRRPPPRSPRATSSDQGHDDRDPAQPLPFHIVLLLVVGPGVESTPGPFREGRRRPPPRVVPSPSARDQGERKGDAFRDRCRFVNEPKRTSDGNLTARRGRDRTGGRPVSWPDAADDSGDRPPHPLGPGVVLARSRRSGLRLVRLLDELLPLLERDLSYARFLLDGQTAVARRLPRGPARGGRRRCAAWLATRPASRSGRGWSSWTSSWSRARPSSATCSSACARATELGGAMPVGYLPDMFGHVAQMPQILRLAGLEHAVVWRGVPVDGHADRVLVGSARRLDACAPSTCTARTRTAATCPTTPSSSSRGRASYELELGDARLPGGGMLLMNGTDHQMPQPWLGRVVAEANAMQDDYRFVVTSLPEYLVDQPTDGLVDLVRASCDRAPAPTCSWASRPNRVDVHQACAAAERAIERRAEPLSRAAPPGRPVPRRAARDRVAEARAEQRARLVVRVQRRRGRRRGDGALPGGAPDRRRARARSDARSSPPRSTRPPGRHVVVNPTQARPRRAHRR